MKEKQNINTKKLRMNKQGKLRRNKDEPLLSAKKNKGNIYLNQFISPSLANDSALFRCLSLFARELLLFIPNIYCCQILLQLPSIACSLDIRCVFHKCDFFARFPSL